MWTCSELLSRLWDITVNMLSCLLHLNQVKALFQIQTMFPVISIVAIAGFKKPKHCYIKESLVRLLLQGTVQLYVVTSYSL